MPRGQEISQDARNEERFPHSLPLTVSASSADWQQSLANAIRNPRKLLEKLQLPVSLLPAAEAASAQFPLLVPESYLARMQSGNLHDPLLMQVLPVAGELNSPENFRRDPVGDTSARKAAGLLQKYEGRALLVAHGSCAIHCRYCFRRHYPYQQEPRSLDDWQPTLKAIAEDSSLKEIILSGGDPLVLSDRRLRVLIETLAEIPHLRRVRIHSRLPIVLPNRVTSSLLELLTSTRLKCIFVVHANHANELVNDCSEALEQLVAAGIPVLNQAVLLKGINDDVESLSALCERCVDLGVLPYYLHQLDQVQGGAHFEVPQEQGRELIELLRRRLPGYAVPRYVLEEEGAASKTPLIQ